MEHDLYVVVKNHEEQYSIWRAERPAPPGWVPAGFRGARVDCLEYIRVHWTDMTPASLRRADVSHGNHDAV
jgi:MbtH protein